jgi:hypothetical protein
LIAQTHQGRGNLRIEDIFGDNPSMPVQYFSVLTGGV